LLVECKRGGGCHLVEHIRHLKASYFRTLDGKLWDEFAQLFTADCEFITYRDPDGLEPKRRCGREAIVDSVRRKVGAAVTVHQGSLLHIEIQFAESATAIWQMTDYTEILEGASRRILRGTGNYYERYRLTDEKWMISRLQLKRTSLVIE
jgi:hypothetical protein